MFVSVSGWQIDVWPATAQVGEERATGRAGCLGESMTFLCDYFWAVGQIGFFSGGIESEMNFGGFGRYNRVEET